jgi:hypothetical protein
MAPVESSLALREETGLPSIVVALRTIAYLVSSFTLLVCSMRVNSLQRARQYLRANCQLVIPAKVRDSIIWA